MYGDCFAVDREQGISHNEMAMGDDPTQERAGSR